jgi:flagellar protein FlbD
MDGPGTTHKEGAHMITLTRLSGSAFVLNSDLIERIDCTPDTVITLIDGKKYVVSESLDAIVEAVRDYRSQVVAFGSQIAEDPAPQLRSARSPEPEHVPASERSNLVPLARPHGEC